MPSTTRGAFPYPAAADNWKQVRAQIQALAERAGVIGALWRQTVAASRGAAGNVGTFHHASDTGQLSFDTGSTWVNVGSLDALYVTAPQMSPQFVGPSQVNVAGIPTWALDPAVSEAVSFAVVIPPAWTQVQMYLHNFYQSSGAGNIRYTQRSKRAAPGASLSAEFSGMSANNVDVTTLAAAGTYLENVATFGPAITVAAGELFAVEVGRLAADAADTYGFDAHLWMVEIRRTA